MKARLIRIIVLFFSVLALQAQTGGRTCRQQEGAVKKAFLGSRFEGRWEFRIPLRWLGRRVLHRSFDEDDRKVALIEFFDKDVSDWKTCPTKDLAVITTFRGHTGESGKYIYVRTGKKWKYSPSWPLR